MHTDTDPGLWTALSARWDASERVAWVALDERGTPGNTRTFAALTQAVARASGWWAAHGVRAGDTVLVATPRDWLSLDLLLGAWRLGAVVLPVNERATADERAWILDDARPKACAWPEDAERIAGEVAAATPVPPVEVSGDAPAYLGYTSGTTGRPKGALSTGRQVRATLASLHAAWEWSAQDVLLHALPTHHVHGLIVGALGALWAGARTAWLPAFTPEATRTALAQAGITVLMGVPTFYTRWLASDPIQGGDAADTRGLRLVTCGSAPLPAHTWNAMRARFGVEIVERYGMTEIGMALSNPLAGPRKPGSVGVPLPGVVVEIRAADGAVCPPGAIGELYVHSPSVFLGYRNRPEATAAALVDGWMRTGDLGYRDADGYVFLTGRASELLLVGGYNVYPREIESVLLDHPAVREAAVLGVPDADLGEVPAAVVVRGAPVDADALTTWVRERLSAYKTPRRWQFVDALPRNAMGKVLKRALTRSCVQVSVRDATADESDRIADWNAAMALETEGITLDPAAARRGAARVFRGDVGANYLIATVDGVPAAQLMLTREWSDWRDREVWWIQSVYVSPRFRRLGLFRTLYDTVQARAAAAGAGGIRLYVDRRNTAAAETYRRVGMDGDHYLVFEQMT
jgi:malonyl-CoA/methylmalonyl-CoA synthetase